MSKLFDKLRRGLSRTRDQFTAGVRQSLGRGAAYEQVERLLIEADVGIEATERLLEAIEDRRGDELESALRQAMLALLSGGVPAGDWVGEARPWVCLVVGVNGVGKTTTIGKLAAALADAGHSVLIGSCDTFRAAALPQLAVWAERAGADLVQQAGGADAASVAFDAVSAGEARGADVILLDTAGRLHNKVNLMEELSKVRRVVAKRLPGAPHEVLLVLDATTGQNGVRQARQFADALGVTGLVLTKLDGTARGGVVVAIAQELGLPVRYVGVGEALDDLVPFEPQEFVDALFAEDSPVPES